MRYFIYARKSTDDEDRQVLSIEAQIKEVREYAQRENLFVVKEIIEAKTAKKPGRPLFNNMLIDIERGLADGILAWHPDRLTSLFRQNFLAIPCRLPFLSSIISRFGIYFLPFI
ncbi:MAG: recombinase family protein [Candidatus Omnitrophica bacterium]|nr:recombinase family protein [Candidatus Omnitrophota bacterium]